ncbi:superoxide dismutase[Cu-Zn] [Granulicella mallensis]|jgi:Cu-Zn family superoxide dismutase|uniref:Superoxide dismutase [Cu-Zn] n=2 Tax=Granulicella mallensis TaxID=940614 RepID=G8NX45_GRAMM|nr:superoxide dismutase family protein [Granulicella mallensis]AEU36659.1 superoxide dismutase copper/zinc binding protein [Granulicella mallensis MP5ACTX8]MBB5062293.1 Cu-Zn family superoxide dismutase [Granulicella mallensis]
MRFASAIFSTIILATAVSAQAPSADHTSELKNGSGSVLGKVTVTGTPRGVLLRIEAKGLTPGWHGMHFHEKGDCGDAMFKGAGAHVHAKTPVVHGLLNADANDAGDLPNLFVAADGTATVELYSTLVTLKGGDERPALLDADGSSLIIHANPDDYQSQPIGGAGGRVACAVIR